MTKPAKPPNPGDYDQTSVTGVEKFNADRKQYQLNLREQIVKSVRKPSYFASLYLGIDLFEYNRKYVDDLKSRWIIYRAGRKVGKSTSTAVKVLHMAWFADIFSETVKDRCDILIVAPTLAQANIMMDVIKTMAHRTSAYAEYIIRETQTEIDIAWLSDGGVTRIYTRAAGDTGRSLRGYIPHLIIVDEAAFVKNPVLIALVPAAMGQKAKIWLTSTPFGKIGYFYEKHLDANMPDVKNRMWKEYHVSSLDNPVTREDPIFIDELKKLAKEQYEQEVLGNFLEEGDAMFPIEMLKAAVVESIKLPNSVRYYMGVDLARVGKDETVFTLIAVDDNEKVYVIRTYSEAQSNLVDLVDRIAGWCRDYPIETVFMDETGLGAGAVDLALNRDLPVEGIVFTLQSKEEMYTTLRLLFENKRIKLSQIDKLIYQLSYVRREYVGGHMRVVVDEGNHDDYADSLALACNAVGGGEKWVVGSKLPDILAGGMRRTF